MNLFQILAASCSESVGEEFVTLISAARWIFNILLFLIPATLLVLGTIDMFKAMTSSDDKAAKQKQKDFIRRLIYAVVAFCIPFIIKFVFSMVANAMTNSETTNAKTTTECFFSCWSGQKGCTKTVETEDSDE